MLDLCFKVVLKLLSQYKMAFTFKPTFAATTTTAPSAYNGLCRCFVLVMDKMRACGDGMRVVEKFNCKSVSYTHLTLPTILRV